MNDLSIIDQFTAVFSRYIDTGFGLLHGEVAHLSAILIGIDITLAGLMWAMGGEDDVIVRLIKKILYVGAFAFIIGNFNALASIVFRSFAGLGLLASGSALSAADFLHPGRLAKVGADAGAPLLTQIGVLSGFPDVFLNLDTIAVLFLAWLIVIVGFFILAVQLFVTLIEFKLVTLAGFVIIPFALWNKTAFLAERVLGGVVSAGIKVLVLAIIAGIGAGIFGQFNLPPGTVPGIDNALTLMLASLAMLGLGIFGPGIATGLIAGAPQLGAGAAVGTLIGAGGVLAAGGAIVAGGARVVSAGLREATSLATGARGTAQAAAASESAATAAATDGLAGAARTGVEEAATVAAAQTATESAIDAVSPEIPEWARDAARREQLARGINTATQTLRSADHGGTGAHPDLTQQDE